MRGFLFLLLPFFVAVGCRPKPVRPADALAAYEEYMNTCHRLGDKTERECRKAMQCERGASDHECGKKIFHKGFKK